MKRRDGTITVDFIELIPGGGKKKKEKVMLVITDMFSKWVDFYL